MIAKHQIMMKIKHFEFKLISNLENVTGNIIKTFSKLRTNSLSKNLDK